MVKVEKFSGKFSSPGKGKGKARPSLKGRQIDPKSLIEIQDLLGDRPRRRDLLIEFLHLIQDHYNGISHRHLAALAGELKISMAFFL